MINIRTGMGNVSQYSQKDCLLTTPNNGLSSLVALGPKQSSIGLNGKNVVRFTSVPVMALDMCQSAIFDNDLVSKATLSVAIGAQALDHQTQALSQQSVLPTTLFSARHISVLPTSIAQE